MKEKPSFGMRLRELRNAAKMTQDELAVRSGVHLQTVAKLETDQVKHPTWKTVLALAHALGVSVEEFDPDSGYW